VQTVLVSGAGVFTSTGAQTVRLNGQGTPNAVGTATFTPTGGCSFNVTIAAAPAAGAFTYDCSTAPRVAGIYTVGTALNASNTVTIDVNVTTLGSYSVNTGAAVNGVVFSTSGVFTTTGVQTITLTSTSTPTPTAGSFSYTPSGAGGCGFSVTYAGGGGGGDFLKSTINGGAVVNFNEGLIATNTPGSSPIPSAFLTSGDVNATGNESLSITALDDIAAVSARNYPNITIANFFNGCAITYTDAAGVDWSSSLLTSNTFTLNITLINATKATGSFSGKVYDNNGSGPGFKTLNGSFSVTF
jgi:hypothetical protein